ncbi:MAG: hypothetical protein ABIQ95_16220 [Bdellovibrionia bacterium]
MSKISDRAQLAVLFSIPIWVALFVWLSPLSFIPVPWPDDSAFYFVAKSLFSWPPRWVMLPQAPFEPTYRIFNFNTMPLYPILIGLGRFLGIDGSFLLKVWPLGAWALTGSYFVSLIYRRGLPFGLCLIWVLAFSLDPELRWASVLVRPESLIGLFGIILVSGLTLGFPKRFAPTRLWDPVAALLALSAYSHFNAIHLLFPVIFTFGRNPKRLFEIGAKTSLYLAPWLLAVLLHWNLFKIQMITQWTRLAVPNNWLDNPYLAISSLFQNLGSPEKWPDMTGWASVGMWLLIISAYVSTLLSLMSIARNKKVAISIIPAFGWIIGAAWIWHSKPEVWFVYYLHVATWFFVGIAALKFWKFRNSIRIPILGLLFSTTAAITSIFLYVDVDQAVRLEKTESWHWSTYYDFVNCIDKKLTELHTKKGLNQPFSVWDPTFPDVTIELSRKHPTWELTRTNDFISRSGLAVQHGRDVDAVVVTEIFQETERSISAVAEDVPHLQSEWMHFRPYFLNVLWSSPGWKPNRYVCQRGRWQAFIFMKTYGASDSNVLGQGSIFDSQKAR